MCNTLVANMRVVSLSTASRPRLGMQVPKQCEENCAGELSDQAVLRVVQQENLVWIC